jgi:hypothetical protein
MFNVVDGLLYRRVDGSLALVSRWSKRVLLARPSVVITCHHKHLPSYALYDLPFSVSALSLMSSTVLSLVMLTSHVTAVSPTSYDAIEHIRKASA